MPRQKPLHPGNEPIYARLCQVTGATKVSQLGKFLGISGASVHKGVKDAPIPDRWIREIAQRTGYSEAWLRTGKGPQRPRLVEHLSPQVRMLVDAVERLDARSLRAVQGIVGILMQMDDAERSALVYLIGLFAAQQENVHLRATLARLMADLPPESNGQEQAPGSKNP